MVKAAFIVITFFRKKGKNKCEEHVTVCLFKNNAYKQYAREQDEIWRILSQDLRWENKTYKLKRSFGLKSHDNSSRPTTLGQLWNIFADSMSRLHLMEQKHKAYGAVAQRFW